jgi:secernin
MVAVQSHTADKAVWFAKNSDREPGEAQVVEHLPQRKPGRRTLRCTYVEIPQTETINEIVISRPFWMWGAEIGSNEHGVTIGNEAVWTRLPIAKTGLTGMDLLRVALERSSSAREALEVITYFLNQYEQGGNCGYRNKKFRYHNSFIIADPLEAWVLESAGRFWAAERVRSVRTISNVLSIGKEFDLLGRGAFEFAKGKGWCRSAEDFDFARSFGDPAYRTLTGGAERSSCTIRKLTKEGRNLERDDFLAALRDHNGQRPADGWKMVMPCAHSSWMKTRRAGQTTGSMISRLAPQNNSHWLTGTSSPCLSVFKPIRLGSGLISTGTLPGRGYDSQSLFWRHERLHRLVLADYGVKKQFFNEARQDLESRFLSTPATAYSSEECESMWEEHRYVTSEWVNEVEKANGKKNRFSLFHRYWEKQEKLEHQAGN